MRMFTGVLFVMTTTWEQSGVFIHGGADGQNIRDAPVKYSMALRSNTHRNTENPANTVLSEEQNKMRTTVICTE